MPTTKTRYYDGFTRCEELENYKGLTSHSLPGLHMFAMDLIQRYIRPSTSDREIMAVDLGAGQGAFSLRLIDADLSVIACDYVSSNFRLTSKKLTFRQIDLNSDFEGIVGSNIADLVCAIEIIEHLENPRHFLRQCAAVAKKSGFIILSTPNIDSPRSKVDFILEGQFHMFRNTSYHTSGHITPISRWQLSLMFDEAGLDVIEHATFGTEKYTPRERPKAFLLQEMIRRFGARMPEGDGAIHVALLRKR